MARGAERIWRPNPGEKGASARPGRDGRNSGRPCALSRDAGKDLDQGDPNVEIARQRSRTDTRLVDWRCRAVLVAAVALACAALSGAGLWPRRQRWPSFGNGSEIVWQNVGPGIQDRPARVRPVVMVFHASWCTSCKRYRQVWKDPGVVAASRDLVMILVDVDTEPTANGAFSPDGTYVPRTIFIRRKAMSMKDLRGKDPEYPHTIDLDDPTELRTLMQKAAKATPAPDKRAQ